MAGVNVQMGVSGIGQFKQNINTARNSLKTLDAQLSLTEKQFQATGDKETYMQEKTELLKVKLEEQKAIASQAEQALAQMAANGVDKASKAYQDMQQQLLKAKADMLDTENQLSGVGEAGDEAANGVSAMNAQLKRIGDGVNLSNVAEGLGKISSGLKNAASKAINLGRRLVEAGLGAGEWADELHTTATVYGISDDQLQRMRKTAELIDTPVEAIISAQKKLKKGMGSADEGVMGAFAALFGEGYDPSAKGWETAFWDAGEAIMKFADAEEKEVYAQKLFGRSWDELIPLFEAGREEYEKTNAAWNTVSDEQIQKLTTMDDEYRKLMANWETFKIEVLSAFSGPLTQGMEGLNGLMEKFTEYLQSDDGQALIDNIVRFVTDGLQWIFDHKTEVIKGIEGIGIAFAGLKIVEIGANIGRVVDGFARLIHLGGGGGNAPVTDAPVAAPVSGGWLTGLRNWMTGAGANAANIIGSTGMFFPVLGDWLTHESPLAGLFNGESVGDWWERMKAEQQERTDTFASNWDPNSQDANVIARNARNTMIFWDDFWSTAMTGDKGWNWSPEKEEDWGGDANDLMAAIARRTDEMERGASDVQDGGKDIKDAAKDMSKLPEDTAAAVQKALNGSRVVIDGGALTAVVGQYMAGLVAQYVK